MNRRRWNVLKVVGAAYVIFFCLGLLYQVAHRGYPPKPLSECFELASWAGVRFAMTPSGILFLLGCLFAFCMPSKRDRRR